jgi:ankyrin repeat protein
MPLLHQIGDTIATRYRILDTLGEGGGSIAYRVEDLQSGELLALKALSLHGAAEWKAIALFEREAQVLAQLNHPAIPRYEHYFQVDTTGDRTFYIAQELVPGKSLAELVQEGWHASELEVKQVAQQLLEILIYLHGLAPPVIHRDIKPENIIRREDGRVFLVDFGAVQDTYHSTIAKSNTVVGTFGYMAPEQFRGQSLPASDLYGLGATLLFVLTHRSPADLPTDGLHLNFRDRLPISPAFADWLEKMLEPDVGDRFSSAKAALAALTSQKRLRKSNPIPWTALVGGGIAAVVAGAVLNSFQWTLLHQLGVKSERICHDADALKNYLNRGGNPNFQFHRRPSFSANDANGEATPLIICVVKRGDEKSAELLISEGADVRAKTLYAGETPLHRAAQRNWQNLTKLLISRGVDINAKTTNPIEHTKWSDEFNEESTPLHWAAAYSSRDLVEILIANGANVNAKDATGGTLLHWAARNPNADVLQMLLNQGFNANVKTFEGENLLHWVARYGSQNAASLLISKGFDVNARTSEGQTPLHLTVYGGSKDVAELLIAKGANVNARDKSNKTPLQWVVERGSEADSDQQRKENSKELAEFLVSRGADISANANENKTLLHWSVGHDSTYLTKLLIANRFDVNAVYKSRTPLHIASLSSSKEVVSLLITGGANVNAKGILGCTALYVAAFGRKEIVELLLANGADVNARCDVADVEGGGSPLSRAFSSGRVDIAVLLMRHGAVR